MDPDVFPNQLEYWGPTGMVFFRNVHVRWMPLTGDRSFMLALEHVGVVGRPKVTGRRGIQIWVPVVAGYSFADTRAWVEQAIAASGAAVPGDLGRAMGALMKAHKGEVDGNLARRLATVGRKEALIGHLPMTGEELPFILDEIDHFQVID